VAPQRGVRASLLAVMDASPSWEIEDNKEKHLDLLHSYGDHEEDDKEDNLDLFRSELVWAKMEDAE
jgi:hypothetical protein